MAYLLTDDLNEVKIYDEKTGSTQSLYARDPSPQEQLAYERERVIQKKGKVQNRIRQTRLKFGLVILDHAQAAQTPQDDGYALLSTAGEFVPLTVDLNGHDMPVDTAALEAQYARAYGADWARFIGTLPAWKLFMLAKVPGHVERVASVVFEGAADYKQGMGEVDEENDEGDSLGN